MHAAEITHPGEPAAPVREIALARGRRLFLEGDPAVAYYEILSGTLRCSQLTHDGRRQIFRFAGSGQMLGVGCVGSHGYTCEALTPVIARRHRLATLDDELANDGDLRRRVLQALRDELAATRSQMMLLGRMSAAERLASFLLDFAARAPRTGGCITLPMTRNDIADYLGLTIETVSRRLNELHARGVIRLETPTRIRITDPGRIGAIADAA